MDKTPRQSARGCFVSSVGTLLSLEGMHRAEALAIAEILHQAQRNQRDGHQRDDIGMLEAGQRTQQRDHGAGGGDQGETERVDLAALDECGEPFAIDALGHGMKSLLEAG